MKKQILALCDSEAEYTRRFCEYAGKKSDIPFQVAAFTSREKLEEFCSKEEVDILLVNETSYDVSMKSIVKGDVLLLRNSDSGDSPKDSIYKYQPCESVLREVLSYCVESSPESIPRINVLRTERLKLIGLYTPVHRTLQTSLAITLGEILARDTPSLYLNFESFSGWDQRLHKNFRGDLTDLVYYSSNAPEALYYKLKGMTCRLNRLDYIPPAFSYMDIASIDLGQWFALFREIESQSEYQYMILDLSENMQGLFDIMRSCCRIITLVRDDGAARAKLYHYEELLNRTEYADIWDKTLRYKAPLIRNLPDDPMEYTHSELAEIARGLLEGLI